MSIAYQPKPNGKGIDVWPHVISFIALSVEDAGDRAMIDSDIVARTRYGKDKYGTVLKTYDGRSTVIDAYQEALDLLFYLTKLYLEEFYLKGSETASSIETVIALIVKLRKRLADEC